jgi:hypothetical protein
MQIIRFIDGNMRGGFGRRLEGAAGGCAVPQRPWSDAARRRARGITGSGAAYEPHGGKRGQLRFSTVDLTGELVVTDAERFATTLASGIGRAKAFGCGLLLVRPLA